MLLFDFSILIMRWLVLRVERAQARQLEGTGQSAHVEVPNMVRQLAMETTWGLKMATKTSSQRGKYSKRTQIERRFKM